ncbi:MAG: hypothetical protein PQJ59_08010 [Spirochaetales bacterium]|nr:hypothetical protein [Spirochaetales bacterium]
MKKFSLMFIVIVMSLFASCASYSYKTGFVKVKYSTPPASLKAQVHREIEQEVYLRVSEESAIPAGSSILIVGALANKGTLYFVEALETELKNSELLEVKGMDSIQEFYPSYPCTILSRDNEIERDAEGVVPEFESFDKRKMVEIGEAVKVDYVYMVYVDMYGKYGYSLAGFFSSKELVAQLSKVKGTLWDVKAGEVVANTFFYESESTSVSSGPIVDNQYSRTENLLMDVSEKAATQVSKEMIKDVL